MRVDKFLKVSRIIKRRTVAKEFTDAGKVTINDKPAKAGDIVKKGDFLAVRFGNRVVQYRILEVVDNASKEAAKTMVEEV